MSQLEGRDFILRGAAILAGDDLDFLPVGDIEVRHGVVARIARELHDPVLPIIDISGTLAVPAFVNGHTHLLDAVIKEIAYDSEPGTNLFFPPDGVRPNAPSHIPRETVLDAMRLTAHHMVATGTAAFADFTSGGVAGTLLLKEACKHSPLRCISLGTLSDSPIQSQSTLDRNREGLSAEQMAELEEVLAAADGVAPVRAADVTDTAMQDFHRLAKAAGKLVATHATVMPSYRETSFARTGRSDVERIADYLQPDFVVHMTDANDAELRRVIDSEIAIIMCARGNATLGIGFPPYADAIAMGATVGFGTDNIMLESPDLVAELGYISRSVRASGDGVHRPSPIDLLKSATIEGARALKIDKTLGSLGEGKSASMVLFDMQNDNLAYSRNPVASVVHRATRADIKTVIIDGVVSSGSLP